MSFIAPFPGSAVVTRTFTASGTSATTFSGISIGTADGSRIVVVAISLGVTAPSSVTLDGTAMNLQVNAPLSGGANRARIYTLPKPAGTTATVAIVGAGGSVLGIGVYAMYGAASETPTATIAVAALSGTINIPANGVCIGCAGTNNGTGANTWTGLTRDYAVNLTTTPATSASDQFATAQVARTVSISAAGASFGLAVGAWGP